MMTFPHIAEYLLYDILDAHPRLVMKKMFGETVILCDTKILFLVSDLEVFCRENPYIVCTRENQFSYTKGNKEVYMKFFRIPPEVFEDKETMGEILGYFLRA